MKLNTAVSVFCCLLQRAVAQVDISGCCTHVKIETTGEASIHQGNRIGEYRLTGVLAERPIYKNTEREEFLFYLQSKNKGLWMVGPTAGQFNGGLAHRGDTYCVEDVPVNQWKYTDGSAWHVDPLLRVSCIDQSVTPQCLYNDQTEFVGGDLPEVFGGGGVETSMESSADCIEECEKRSGCNYWTWVMGEKVNCFLKNRKVDTVRKPKHVSGSIPKACSSTPPTPTQSPSTYSVCTYNSLDFQGGDLFSVLANDVDDCRQQCEDHVSCQLFTFDKGLERGCYFKTDQVKVTTNEKVVSGATAEICEDFILPHVTKKDEESTYNENEVNGKFKITSLRWDEKLSNPNSQEYLDLSNTIEDSLESMLRSERDLDEQAEFSVKVQKFRKGSVVCDFKVNYILKEAYIAIPFAIKPSNITDAMNKNFKFKKGILFQRFLIAAGSFNSSAPVDHCAAKGCSHKCDYDYDVEDYLCTCPRSLVLDQNEKKCISPEEAATEKTVDDTTGDTEAEDDVTTILPEVKLTLLPTACLWSPWSDWTACSSSCGTGKKERQRSVVLPEKNGGACPGRFKEFVECSVECDGEVGKDIKDILEETVTAFTEIGGSESDNEDEQTTVYLKVEDNVKEIVTDLINVTDEKDGSENNTEQTTLPFRDYVIDVDEKDGLKPNNNVEETTISSNTDLETVTDIVRENNQSDELDDLNDLQTTVSVNEDDFGRQIPAETTESQEIQGPAEDINETKMNKIVPETTTTINNDLTTVSLDENQDEQKDDAKDQNIIFPLTEDAEVITSTELSQIISTTLKATKEDTTNDGGDTSTSTLAAVSDEMKDNTEVPELSVDIQQEEKAEEEESDISQERTTFLPTIATENKSSETSFDSDNTTINVIYIKQEEEGSSEIEIPTENLEPENTTLNIKTEENEVHADISESENTAINIDSNEAEMRTDHPETDETDSTTMKDIDSGKDSEYETTTNVDEMGVKTSETDATTIQDITIEPEVSTQSGAGLTEDSIPDNRSTQIDDEDNNDEDKNDEDTNYEENSDEDNNDKEKNVEEKNAEDKNVEEKNDKDKNDEDKNDEAAVFEDDFTAEITTIAMDTTGKEAEADGTTEENTVAQGVTEDVAQDVADDATQGVTDDVAQDATDEVTQGVTDHVVQGVTDDIVQGVTDNSVQGVTDEVAKGLTDDVIQSVTDEVVFEGVTDGVVVQGVTDDVAVAMEITTSTSGADDTEKAPRFDTENEEQTVETPEEIPEEESFTTANPVQSDAGVKPTALTVISIKETTEEVMIVTTVKPTTVTDDDNKDSTNEEDIIITEENDEKEQEFDDIDTSTPSSEYGDHEFLCKEAAAGDEESDVPMECVLTNGEEERTVVIVIPRDSLGGGRDKLFDKNVKIVVKDFMVMERSPRTLS